MGNSFSFLNQMFKAAVWAMNLADKESNSSVPATAPADFQAGVLDAMFGTDLKAQMNECFIPDQKLADNTTALIADVEAKNWTDALTLVKQFEQEALVDAAPCESDPKYQDVNDAYYQQQDLVETAMADPDWQAKAVKAVLPHMVGVKKRHQGLPDQVGCRRLLRFRSGHWKD